MNINQLLMRVGLDALLAIFPFTGSLAQILKDTPTFKAYDFRGSKNPDASMEYALKNVGPGMPVIVDVQGKGDSLLKVTGKIMKEMDLKGYKNMVLLASDLNTGKAMEGCILFYGNGAYYGMLIKGLTDDGKKIWLYYDQSRTLVLQKYPKDFSLRAFIRQKINEAYKASGAAAGKN